MIKVEVIENFRLEKFSELKNVERKKGGIDGNLYVGDTFECSEEMVKYLTGKNALNKVVVKIIEYIPEEKEKETIGEKKEEIIDKTIEEKKETTELLPKKAKKSKK